MKRKSLRTLVCALLASLALTTFAFADNGPKPQLIVRVKDAPQELYYLDLLAKGDWDAEDGNRIDGIDWNYDGKRGYARPRPLSTSARQCSRRLARLRGAGPTGRTNRGRGCTRKGRTPLAMHCTGSATSVCRAPTASSSSPNPARSGSPIYSIAAFCNRPSRSTGRTIRPAVTVSVPSTIPGYLLQFVATLVPTLLIEGALLLLFRYSWKKNWEAFLLVNVLTQGFLAVASVYVTAHNGVSAWYLFFFLLPAELIILLVELYLYAGCGLLTGHSKGRAAAYAITANLASAVLGYYLAVPVWRLVVSIL